MRSNTVVKVHCAALSDFLALSLQTLRLPLVYRSIAIHAILPELVGSLLRLILLLKVVLVLNLQHLRQHTLIALV